MATTTDLSVLKINYLTQAQYDAEVSGGTIDPNQLYMTPASGSGVSDVEVDGTSVVTGGIAYINLQSSIVDVIYPVGSIYMSVNAVDPATLFPGTTWSQIQDKFLLAAGSTYSNGSSGGEATHTLTPSETALKTHTHSVTLGSHRHYPYGGSSYKFVQSNGGTVTNAGGISGSGTRYYITSGISNTANWQAQTGATDLGSKTTDGLTEANGSAHNNMPPYLTVNIWQRVS